ncbi:MAG: MFS transporter [Chloroflexota bacterium]
MTTLLRGLLGTLDGGLTGQSRRNLLAVSLASFLASVGFMVVMPLLPTLLRETSADGAANMGLWLGLAISVAPLLTAATGPLWTAMGERLGHKMMIERSLVFVGLAIGALAIVASPSQVVAVRAIIGGLGGTSVAALAAITAGTPRRQLGPAVGTLQASQTAGSMVGPAIGGLLGAAVGMREAFLISGAVFLAALVLVHYLFRDGPAPIEATPRASRESARPGGLFSAGLVAALIAGFLVQFVEGGLLVFLPLQLANLGAEEESLPWIMGMGLSLVYLAATISAAVAGRLAAKHSPVMLLRWTALAALAAVIPLALATTWIQFLGARILLGLVAGAAPTLIYATAATLATAEQRGRVVSFVSSAGILGWAASPLATGTLAQDHPTEVVSCAVGIYAVVAATLFALEHGLPGRLGLPISALPRLVHALAGLGQGLTARGAEIATTPRPPLYSRTEVFSALTQGTGPRSGEILAAAAQMGVWMPTELRSSFGTLDRFAVRLPTILARLRAGHDAEAIGQDLSPMGGAWNVNRTVEIAAGFLADRLNRSR